MDEMTIRIVTPDKTVFEGTINRLRMYGLIENFTLLPRHAPLVEILNAGELELHNVGGEEIYIGINGGILEVSDNHVNILAEEASKTAQKGEALDQMKQNRRNRKEENDQKRIQLLKSEMELYRLLRQAKERR